MTSQYERLEELRQQAKALAEQIEQLEDQINNAQPTTGLLGRWATHPQYGNVLIAMDRATSSRAIRIMYLSNNKEGGATYRLVNIDDIAFPDQTTRPQDVPVGEAWLIDADAGDASTTNAPAVKESTGLWITGENNEGGVRAWSDNEVTLITPLIPARPQDNPETVTTEDEYGELPEGSIVAENNGVPWQKLKSGEWISHIFPENRPDDLMDGVARRILRRGYGK